jgi:hypothetical protein
MSRFRTRKPLYLIFLICFTVYTWTTLLYLYLYLYMYVKRTELNGRLFSFATFANTENAEVRIGTAVGGAVNTTTEPSVPYGMGNFLANYATTGYSRRTD